MAVVTFTPDFGNVFASVAKGIVVLALGSDFVRVDIPCPSCLRRRS
jgi:hypothetical protein